MQNWEEVYSEWVVTKGSVKTNATVLSHEFTW